MNGSSLPTSYQLNMGENRFKIKVSNNEGCYKDIELVLTLNPKPKISLPESMEFCNGKFATLDAGVHDSYLWSTGETAQTIVTDKEGIYTVKVKNVFGCESTATINLKKSVLATIESVNITNNNATVKLSSTGDFLYSLDYKVWQNSNVFNNLKNGNYTVYVKTAGDCIIGEKNFTIFSINNSFSPNGDGQNDTWKISGLENYPGSEITVVDRYGNSVLKVITDKSAFEWDGTYNKRVLATGNYWYVIKITDGRVLNGWLSLKNRN